MELKIAGTANDSIVDGPGLRLTNPQTHDFNGGYVADIDELLKKIISNPLLDGVTFSGGEPFCQAPALAELGRKIKKSGLNIITYTGYDFEYLYDNRDKNGWGELLDVTDFLIDGKFILAEKDWNIRFRGSSNQRILA